MTTRNSLMNFICCVLQQVLYNLCEWPRRNGSRLAVIGIASALCCPTRLMLRTTPNLGGVSRKPC